MNSPMYNGNGWLPSFLLRSLGLVVPHILIVTSSTPSCGFSPREHRGETSHSTMVRGTPSPAASIVGVKPESGRAS